MTVLAADGLGDFWRLLIVAALALAFLLSFVLRYAAWSFMSGRRKRKQLNASATAADEARPPD